MLRQAQHERNQLVTVRPELVEGFVQHFRGKTSLAAVFDNIDHSIGINFLQSVTHQLKR